MGKDTFGNKYYESKKGKRWVIYSDEIDASKIPIEWYSWIHFTPNKIEKNHEFKKYNWQKPHQPNLTGTDKAYYPNKNKDAVEKNTKLGKIKLILFIIILFSSTQFYLISKSSDDLEGDYTAIKILDKISSKNSFIKLKNGEELRFKDLLIKSIKCKNSEFDDNPEITAYIQAKDLTKNNKDEVFIFNGWMFSSSPSIAPFDHPVYDVWLVGCY